MPETLEWFMDVVRRFGNEGDPIAGALPCAGRRSSVPRSALAMVSRW